MFDFRAICFQLIWYQTKLTLPCRSEYSRELLVDECSVVASEQDLRSQFDEKSSSSETSISVTR
jgi:hypothetical protein